MDGVRIVGLTGGIGSGKSTVAKMISAAGIPVIDADQLAREVVEPGRPALAEIQQLWPQAIASDGRLDRKCLGEIVFQNDEARARLQAITHPRIHEALASCLQTLQSLGHRLVFYEAALLVETGRHKAFDALVVVSASEGKQLSRVMLRDGISADAARARLAAQLPLAEKVAHADHVIVNDGDRADTQRQVTALLHRLSVDAD